MSPVVPLGTAQRWPRTGQSLAGRFLWYILIIGGKGEGGKLSLFYLVFVLVILFFYCSPQPSTPMTR